MLKYPIFLQDNENSCGAYCIKMLLSFYKRDDEIKNIATRIYDKLRRSKRIYSVEDIQDLIEEYIDKYGCFSLAKSVVVLPKKALRFMD